MDPNARLRYVAWVEFVIKRTALTLTLLYLLYIWYNETVDSERRSRKRRYSVIAKQPDQLKHLRRFTQVSDENCVDNLRMDRNAFCRLCYLLEHFGGLTHERFVTIPCKVAMFLNILAHHHKNRTVKGDFYCSGFTVSRYFRQTLKALLRISNVLLIEPVGVPQTCTTEPWKHFKGCLGALDGTYVDVIVRQKDQPKYRTRKGSVAVNVLGVCNPQMNFIYVLAGWEGSAADCRVLRDALHRSNGLKVPAGSYYLADCGYTNADGFLTPYRGTRYHLKEWGAGTSAPQTPKELFNLRHSKARNVIERAFCLLKGRWAILRSKSWYPIKVQNWTILACAVLHNFIRTQMEVDPIEEEVLRNMEEHIGDDREFIGSVEATPMWTNFRDDMANNMFSPGGITNNCLLCVRLK